MPRSLPGVAACQASLQGTRAVIKRKLQRPKSRSPRRSCFIKAELACKIPHMEYGPLKVSLSRQRTQPPSKAAPRPMPFLGGRGRKKLSSQELNVASLLKDMAYLRHPR